MSDQQSRPDHDRISPLSLESAILDVAPKVEPAAGKPETPPRSGGRTRPLGRISLKDSGGTAGH